MFSCNWGSCRFTMIRLRDTVVVVVLVTSIGWFSDAAASDQPDYEARLLSQLLVYYHPSVAPTHNGPVDIRMGFGLGYFDFIDEPKELAVAHGWSYRTWMDPRLQWDLAEYNGTRRVILDRKQIWVPDIEIQNSAKFTAPIESRVMVFNDGRIRYHTSNEIEFICDMNLKYFPYDEQKCEIKFGTWYFTTEVLNLTASSYVNMTRIKTAKDFRVTNFTVKREEIYYRFIRPYAFVDITYTISLQRLHGAYSTKLVLPSVLTGFLILVTFLIPNGSSEKITLCGILFLCLLVLMTFLHLAVPSSGETILGQYLVFALFVNFFATIMAAVSYNVKGRGFSTMKQSDIGLHERMEGNEQETKMPDIHPNPKMRWLQHLDIICFGLFSIVFVIGMAVILAQRA